MTAPRRTLMANHNRCWIWGRNAVMETLRAGRWTMVELLVGDRCDVDTRDEIKHLAGSAGIPIEFLSDRDVEKRCRSDEHQGLAARMPPFPYLTVEQLLQQASAQPIFVLLDRVHDSYNFGAIVRSAEVLGIDGVIVGTREQAQVNSLVVRSSAGAVNSVPIAQTESLIATIETLSQRGVQIVGSSDHAADLIFEVDFCQPTLLIIGNEGQGMHPDLEGLCSRFIKIPVLGQIGSLNAAVSAGILFYEVVRQRGSVK